MTGFGASASLLGAPDVGLLSFAEMVDQARRLVEAAGVPLIADADDGYGNPINVTRTVRAYEAAGVAGLHLEDQLSPKRCGHLEGKQLIAASEMVEKIHAAVEARRSADLVVIARTDARAVEGLDAALERARRYRDAGADVLFVEAPESEAEVAVVAQAFPDTPLLFNAVEGGRTPLLELARLRELGFRLVLCPLTALLAATARRRAGAVALASQRDAAGRWCAVLLRLHRPRRPTGDPAPRSPLRRRARTRSAGIESRRNVDASRSSARRRARQHVALAPLHELAARGRAVVRAALAEAVIAGDDAARRRRRPVGGATARGARPHPAQQAVDERLAAVHETFVVLIEPARTECTFTEPEQRLATGTPWASEAGAHSAAAQAMARSRRRIGPHLSRAAGAQTHVRYRRKRNGESACAQRPGPIPRLGGLDRRRRPAQHARPRAAGRRARLPPLLAGRASRRHDARRAEPRGPHRARSRWPPSASAWAAAA